MGKATKEALGDRAKEAVHLDILATAPDKQGRGYASRLIKVVTDIVSRCISLVHRMQVTGCRQTCNRVRPI